MVAAAGQMGEGQQARGGKPPPQRPDGERGPVPESHDPYLLARWESRPTTAVGADGHLYRKPDAGRVFGSLQVSFVRSRLSTQVYTPIERRDGRRNFFRFSLKSEPLDPAGSSL